MILVSSFMDFLPQLSFVMTAPTFSSFVTVLTGWIFARRRTITGMIVAADAVGTKHHSAFHRVFSVAQWSLDTFGLAVFDLVRQGSDSSGNRRYTGPQTRPEDLWCRHAPRSAAQHAQDGPDELGA